MGSILRQIRARGATRDGQISPMGKAAKQPAKSGDPGRVIEPKLHTGTTGGRRTMLGARTPLGGGK